MLSQIYNILNQFRGCFSRKRPFEYFCLVILAFMLLKDAIGVTSIVRVLFLSTTAYECLIHFFKSKAYSKAAISSRWAQIIEDSPYSLQFNGCNLLLADHIKVSREGKCMPGVKIQHQDSENLNKPETIFGHHFGAVGQLTGDYRQPFCSLTSISIHEGSEKIREWLGEEALPRARQLAADAMQLASRLKKDSYLIWDADFWAINALEDIAEYNLSSEHKLHVVGRCNQNVVCKRELTDEEKAANRERNKLLHKRGAPKKYEVTHLKPWFTDRKDDFKEYTLFDGSKVRLLATLKEWHGMKLLFVLSIDELGRTAIFYTTDLNLHPVYVVTLYKLRFKVEVAFKDLKHTIFGFCYHFWIKHFEKLTKYNSKVRIERVNEALKVKIINCIDRIERLVTFACIALGVLQMMVSDADYSEEIRKIPFKRTYSKDNCLSIWQMKEIFIGIFPLLLEQEPECELTLIIERFRSNKLLSDIFLENLKTFSK